ncbi:hypothetical protein RYX36_014056 [Vicia faba]
MSCGRKSQGRQKIEIKKLRNESNLQVTFSRRRSRLFKKLIELSPCVMHKFLLLYSHLVKRKSQGRQKIEIKKMRNESNLQVTFLRRRSRLFKKLIELSTLCDAQISLVVFSPSEKEKSRSSKDRNKKDKERE